MSGQLIRLQPDKSEARAHLLPTSFDEASRMAKAIANSELFGCKTPEQAYALMLLADAEGLHPAAAMRDYHIIDGKPSLKADAMLGRYQAAGGKVKWIRREDECVVAEFSHPASDSVQITWDKERAIKAGLWSRRNWKTYPIQMLSARVISEGVRVSFPSIVSGIYTPEEVQDFDAKPEPRPERAQDTNDAPPLEVVETNEPPPASRDIEAEEKAARAKHAADAIIRAIETCQSLEAMDAVEQKHLATIKALKARYPDEDARIQKSAEEAEERIMGDGEDPVAAE